MSNEEFIISYNYLLQNKYMNYPDKDIFETIANILLRVNYTKNADIYGDNCLILGEYYSFKENYTESLKYMDKCLEFDIPRNKQYVYYGLGEIYRLINDIEKSNKYYRLCYDITFSIRSKQNSANHLLMDAINKKNDDLVIKYSCCLFDKFELSLKFLTNLGTVHTYFENKKNYYEIMKLLKKYKSNFSILYYENLYGTYWFSNIKQIVDNVDISSEKKECIICFDETDTYIQTKCCKQDVYCTNCFRKWFIDSKNDPICTHCKQDIDLRLITYNQKQKMNIIEPKLNNFFDNMYNMINTVLIFMNSTTNTNEDDSDDE